MNHNLDDARLEEILDNAELDLANTTDVAHLICEIRALRAERDVTRGSLKSLGIGMLNLNLKMANVETLVTTLREERDAAVRERDECLEKLASLASGWKAEHERIRAEMREDATGLVAFVVTAAEVVVGQWWR